MFEETFSQLLTYYQRVINAKDQLTDRAEALLCGFLIKPSFLHPSYMVSETSLYFVVSHFSTRSHHHMVIVRPPLLPAYISALQSLTDIVSDLSSCEYGFHLGTLLVWNSSNRRTVGSSGCYYQLRCVFLGRKGLICSLLNCRFSIWIPIWKFTFLQSFSVCFQRIRLLQSRTTITDSSHMDLS